MTNNSDLKKQILEEISDEWHKDKSNYVNIQTVNRYLERAIDLTIQKKDEEFLHKKEKEIFSQDNTCENEKSDWIQFKQEIRTQAFKEVRVKLEKLMTGHDGIEGINPNSFFTIEMKDWQDFWRKLK